jgi:hypothetical protein
MFFIHLLELAPEDDNNEAVLVNGPWGKEMDPNNDANVCNELEDNDDKAPAHHINGMAEDYNAEDDLPGSKDKSLNGPDANDDQDRDTDSKSNDSMKRRVEMSLVIVMMRARKMLKNESEDNYEDDADRDDSKGKENDRGGSSDKDDSKESSKCFQEQ